MANLTTNSDIKKAVLKHCGELTTGTSPFDATALEYVNRMYQEVLAGGTTFVPDFGEPFEWAKSQTPGVLELVPATETGTVTLTKGSTSGTFSSAPAATQAGRWLKITDRPEFFRIAAHTAAATAFTLDANYTDTTGAGLAFKAYKLDYSLTAGIGRLVEPMRVYRGQGLPDAYEAKIYGTSPQELSRQYPLTALQGGVPTKFAVIGEANGALVARFNAVVSTETRVEYEYVGVPADLADDSNVPLVPREDRLVLVYGATYFLMMDKNDSRADMFFRLAQSKLQAMLLARRKAFTQTGKNFGRMLPRQEDTEAAALRTASGIRLES